jgi:hypothetical protein
MAFLESNLEFPGWDLLSYRIYILLNKNVAISIPRVAAVVQKCEEINMTCFFLFYMLLFIAGKNFL